MNYAIEELLRPNIVSLIPYSSARSEFCGAAEVFLDANENWRDFVGNKGRNRYPDPRHRALKAKIEEVLHLRCDRLVIGNGSDEIIDLLFRICCVPDRDKVLVMSPTYGAYQVFADINGIAVSDCPLKDDFTVDMSRFQTICDLIDAGSPATGMHKLLFLCSPNNPSGNSIPLKQIEAIATRFKGITVVDEAYHEFSQEPSAVELMDTCPRLVVLRTLSKSWALANARVGMIVAPQRIVEAMEKTKYPYNLSGVVQELAIEALGHSQEVFASVKEIIAQRGMLAEQLQTYSFVEEVFPSDANFLLVRVDEPSKLYRFLLEKKIIVRNRSSVRGCFGCVRITVGSVQENQQLLQALDQWEAQS
ncbi:MAG: histidinol-phosphate transaminase [Sphaerochaetaceae bacterium]